MVVVKTNIIVNGLKKKKTLFLLKIMYFLVYGGFLRKEVSYSNNVVMLNAPFHYKVPKSHLGIQNYFFKISLVSTIKHWALVLQLLSMVSAINKVYKKELKKIYL